MSIASHAEHWRLRAVEAHATVEQLDNPESRASMLFIAREFERLTERAETLAKIQKHGSRALPQG